MLVGALRRKCRSKVKASRLEWGVERAERVSRFVVCLERAYRVRAHIPTTLWLSQRERERERKRELVEQARAEHRREKASKIFFASFGFSKAY